MGAQGPRSRGFPSRSGCRRTYDRKLEEIFAVEEIVDAYMQDFDRKLVAGTLTWWLGDQTSGTAEGAPERNRAVSRIAR